MKEFTDTEMLDWIEGQTNGDLWITRQSTNGRGFRLHNTSYYPTTGKRNAREAVTHAMNKELNGLSQLQQ